MEVTTYFDSGFQWAEQDHTIEANRKLIRARGRGLDAKRLILLPRRRDEQIEFHVSELRAFRRAEMIERYRSEDTLDLGVLRGLP